MTVGLKDKTSSSSDMEKPAAGPPVRLGVPQHEYASHSASEGKDRTKFTKTYNQSVRPAVRAIFAGQNLLSSADSKDLANNRSKSRLGKQRSLLRQVSLREDTVSESNLCYEADQVAGSSVSVGGSLRSIAAAKLLRKSGICESCVQVASFSGQVALNPACSFGRSAPGNAADTVEIRYCDYGGTKAKLSQLPVISDKLRQVYSNKM